MKGTDRACSTNAVVIYLYISVTTSDNFDCQTKNSRISAKTWRRSRYFDFSYTV